MASPFAHQSSSESILWGVKSFEYIWSTEIFPGLLFIASIADRSMKTMKSNREAKKKKKATEEKKKATACVCVFLLRACSCLVVSCQVLCHPLGCSLPGFSTPGVLQARILEWVAFSSSRGSSRARDRTHPPRVSCVAGELLTAESSREPLCLFSSLCVWDNQDLLYCTGNCIQHHVIYCNGKQLEE